MGHSDQYGFAMPGGGGGGGGGGAPDPHGIASHLDASARIGSGTDAGKGAASILDRVWFATDTLILYYDTGSAWVEMVRGETAIRLAQLAERSHASLTNTSDPAQHPATAISNAPAGGIAATTVQAAIDELDAEKQPTSAALTDIALRWTPASAAGPATLDFHEDTDNGTNRVRLSGPASTADVTVTLPATTNTLATLAGTETLTNKTLTTPTIGSFANAAHTHQNAAGGGTLDHGLALTGLTDDDHTQYALLAGRATGQTLIGGTASGDDLTLESTSNATKGSIFVASLSTVEIWPTNATLTATMNMIVVDNTFTLGDDNLAIRALAWGPTILNSDTAGLSAINVFRNTATIRNVAGVGVVAGIVTSFNSSPTIQADTDAGITATYQGLSSNPTFSVLNGGTLSVATAIGANLAGVIGAGVTVTARTGVNFTDATGAGTLTNQVAVDIANLTKGGTLNLSLRSAGALVQMRHAGPAVFGANAAPANASVGLEVQSTTLALLLSRMTTAQRDALTAVNGMVIYNSTLNVGQIRQGGAWVTFS